MVIDAKYVGSTLSTIPIVSGDHTMNDDEQSIYSGERSENYVFR